MNPYSTLLIAGSSEVSRYFEQHRPKLSKTENRWKHLAEKMAEAAELTDDANVEGAIRAIARLIVDEFPLNEAVAPSFDSVLGSVQRAEEKRRLRNA